LVALSRNLKNSFCMRLLPEFSPYVIKIKSKVTLKLQYSKSRLMSVGRLLCTINPSFATRGLWFWVCNSFSYFSYNIYHSFCSCIVFWWHDL